MATVNVGLTVEADSAAAVVSGVGVTATAVSAVAVVVAPAVVAGSLSITPAAGSAVAAVVAPAVVVAGGSETVSPSPAAAVSAVVAPGVATGVDFDIVVPTPTASRMSPACVTAFIDTGLTARRLDSVNSWTLSSGGSNEYYCSLTSGGAPDITLGGAWPDQFTRVYEWHDNVSLRNASYRWTSSPNGAAGTYYLEAAGGGDPGFDGNIANLDQYIDTPQESGVDLTLGDDAYALSAGACSWADIDGLGYRTLYVHLSDSSDPDTKPVDHLTVSIGYYLTPGTLGALQPGEYAGGDNDSLGYTSLYVHTRESANPGAMTNGIYAGYENGNTGTSRPNAWQRCLVEWGVSGGTWLDDSHRYVADPVDFRSSDPVDCGELGAVWQGLSANWILGPGTWTITCRVTNDDGVELTKTADVTVATDTRTIHTVDSNDLAADFQSLQTAIGVFGGTDNQAFAIASGHEEVVTASNQFFGNNLHFYHAGSGTPPVFVFNSFHALFNSGRDQSGLVIDGLNSRSDFDPGNEPGNDPQFLYARGSHYALINHEDVTPFTGFGGYNPSNGKYYDPANPQSNNRMGGMFFSGGFWDKWNGSFGLLQNSRNTQTGRYSFIVGDSRTSPYIAINACGCSLGASEYESTARYLQYNNCVVTHCDLDMSLDELSPKSSLRFVNGAAPVDGAVSNGGWGFKNLFDIGAIWLGGLHEDSHPADLFRIDSCLIDRRGALTSAATGQRKNAARIAFVNNISVADTAIASTSLGSSSSANDQPWMAVHDLLYAGNTTLDTAGSGGIVACPTAGDDFTAVANILQHGGSAAYVFNSYTASQYGFSFTNDAYIDNVADSSPSGAWARLGLSGVNLATLNADPLNSGNQEVSFTLDSNYTPSTPVTVSTPAGLHRDFYGRTRSSTSWAGALSEAAPSLNIATPSPATAVAGVSGANVPINGIQVTPATAASALGGQVAPAVVVSGSQSYTIALAATTESAPAVTASSSAGSLVVSPDPVESFANTPWPVVVQGNVSLVMGPASGVGASAGAVPAFGSLSATPAASVCVASAVSPVVTTATVGNIVAQPSPAPVVGAVIQPNTIAGSLVLTPGASVIGTEAIRGSVSAGSDVVIPQPASAIAWVIWPDVIGGQVVSPSPIAPPAPHVPEPTLRGQLKRAFRDFLLTDKPTGSDSRNVARRELRNAIGSNVFNYERRPMQQSGMALTISLSGGIPVTPLTGQMGCRVQVLDVSIWGHDGLRPGATDEAMDALTELVHNYRGLLNEEVYSEVMTVETEPFDDVLSPVDGSDFWTTRHSVSIQIGNRKATAAESTAYNSEGSGILDSSLECISMPASSAVWIPTGSAAIVADQYAIGGLAYQVGQSETIYATKFVQAGTHTIYSRHKFAGTSPADASITLTQGGVDQVITVTAVTPANDYAGTESFRTATGYYKYTATLSGGSVKITIGGPNSAGDSILVNHLVLCEV